MSEQASLDDMDIPEIEAHIAAAQAKLNEKRSSNLADAMEEIKAVLARRTLTIDILLAYVNTTSDQKKGRETRKPRSDSGQKLPPKYRNPANPDETWNGKGRPPKWIVDGESAGKKREDFLIPQS